MAEQTPINTGSSAAEPVDGAPKDNVQEAPVEQADDKKNGAPEMLKCDSSDSASASEKDSASGDDNSDKDSASKSASNSDSDGGDSSSKVVKKDKKKKKGLVEQIKEKFIKKSEELAVDVPEKALDDHKLECKSSDSDSDSDDSKSSDGGDDSKSSDDSSGDSKSSESSQDDSKSKSKALEEEEEEEEAQEKPIDGTGGDPSSAAPVKQMGVEEAEEEKGVLENVKGKL